MMKTTGGGKGLKINQVIHTSQPTGPGLFQGTVSSLRTDVPDQRPGRNQRLAMGQEKPIKNGHGQNYQDAMHRNSWNGLRDEMGVQ